MEAGSMQAQLSGMVHHPLNSVLPLLLVPLITIVARSLKRSKTATAAAPSAVESS